MLSKPGCLVLILVALVVAGKEAEEKKEGKAPITKDEIQAFLKECEFFGELGGHAAASAACKVVLNKCPRAAPLKNPDVSARASKKTFPGFELEERLRTQLDVACRTTTLEICANAAFFEAELVNEECHAILTRGPAFPFSRDCVDVVAANCLFNAHVNQICGKTKELDESYCGEKKKTEPTTPTTSGDADAGKEKEGSDSKDGVSTRIGGTDGGADEKAKAKKKTLIEDVKKKVNMKVAEEKAKAKGDATYENDKKKVNRKVGDGQ